MHVCLFELSLLAGGVFRGDLAIFLIVKNPDEIGKIVFHSGRDYVASDIGWGVSLLAFDFEGVVVVLVGGEYLLDHEEVRLSVLDQERDVPDERLVGQGGVDKMGVFVVGLSYIVQQLFTGGSVEGVRLEQLLQQVV